MSETFVKNSMANTFEEILEMRTVGFLNNDDDFRRTYHSSPTKNASELIPKIINKGLPKFTQLRVTLNEIILNPTQYLSQEMLDNVTDEKGIVTEGAVYHYLKSWFEDNTDNISIDRDATTHEYLFVDDNAFDDLLNFELQKNINDETGRDLIEKYTSEDGLGLNRFFNLIELSYLGLPSNIKVIANKDAITQTQINDTYPNGAIFIKTTDDMSNAEFIDSLCHEFRHIMQHHNNFEQGFTPNFEVTADMIADIKIHVPEIYENKYLIKLAKYMKVDAETLITQRFVYFMMGSEQNAYGFRSRWLNAKPFYVMEEGGKPTIFMSWYNAKTGDGRYPTEYLAARATDDEGFKMPMATKRPHKYIEKKTTYDETGKAKHTYKQKRQRYFSNESAKGTNLEHFIKKGKQNDMDPKLQEFIIATTNKEKEMGDNRAIKALLFSITEGKTYIRLLQ